MHLILRFTILELFLIMIIGLLPQTSMAQSDHFANKGFPYLFPFPGATQINPENNLIIKHVEAFEAEIDPNMIRLTDSLGNPIRGHLKMLESGHTLLYQPDADLPLNTIIQVNVGRLPLLKGSYSQAIAFSFRTREQPLSCFKDAFIEAVKEDLEIGSPQTSPYAPRQERSFELPDDYPQYFIQNTGSPANDDYYFQGASIGNTYYQCIFDRNNVPYFYRKTTSRSVDFKLNGKGYLMTYDVDAHLFVEYDSAYDFQRTYACGNGYFTDFHDILVLENGHYYVIGLEFLLVDMSQYISCGQTNATVRFPLIQELDENDNVVFQWRTYDHFNIMDGDTNQLDFCAQQIDFCHLNSVATDASGNIIISSRHMNEVTKIDGVSGAIIWRFGGINSMFQVLNDPMNGFYDQHSARENQEDIISIFDNHSTAEPHTSRGVKYAMDTTNWTAEMQIAYDHNPQILTFFAGHMQETANGQIILAWAYNNMSATLTEYDPDGSPVTDITYDTNVVNNSYRAFKFPWKTTYFSANTDSLDFGNQNLPGQTSIVPLSLFNPRNHDIILSGSHVTLAMFGVESQLPITIPAGEQIDIDIRFTPIFDGDFQAKLTLLTQTDTSGVAIQVQMEGSTLQSGLWEQGSQLPIQVYPNPFKDVLTIKTPDGSNTEINISNAEGKIIHRCILSPNGSSKIHTAHWMPGIYTLSATSSITHYSSRIIKIK